jgi:aconitate hydratase
LNLDGSEVFDITGLDGDVRPGMTVTLTIHRANGGSEQAPLLCRIDTLDEMDYYRSGGILQFVLNKLSEAA